MTKKIRIKTCRDRRFIKRELGITHDDVYAGLLAAAFMSISFLLMWIFSEVQ